MTTYKGYYSIIQFCPDDLVGEVANVGVLLFCPDKAYLKAVTVKNNGRVIRYFGSANVDVDRVNFIKRGLESRIEKEAHSIRTKDDLVRFIATRANQLHLTPLRTMGVTDPQKDMEELFVRVVGEAPPRAGRKTFRQLMAKKLLSGNEKKVFTDVRVNVPVFEKEVEFPFAYQNGRFNLIGIAKFLSNNLDSSRTTACRYAVEGESLYESKHPRFGPMELNVVCQYKPGDFTTPRLVERLLKEHPGEPTIIVVLREADPPLVLLAGDERFGGFPLGVE